ncbi:MAG TPA: prepilin-type N-terminal cleavage/methylation domain-containing protein, partial [Myxococcota bacterium]
MTKTMMTTTTMRTTTTRQRRGFTLLELMVATALALGVVTAATSAVLLIIRTLNRTGQSSAMVTEVQMLSEYLV